MPVLYAEVPYPPPPPRVRIYRGWYGETAKEKIRWSQRRKGVQAVFPNCR